MALDDKDRAVRRFHCSRRRVRPVRSQTAAGVGRVDAPSTRTGKHLAGRSKSHVHEDALRAARAAQKTPEERHASRERLSPRAKVERKISELCRRHAWRRARYRGEQKTDPQAVLTATMANAKRLTFLDSTDAERGGRIRAALAA